jgi:hypothetical protein
MNQVRTTESISQQAEFSLEVIPRAFLREFRAKALSVICSLDEPWRIDVLQFYRESQEAGFRGDREGEFTAAMQTMQLLESALREGYVSDPVGLQYARTLVQCYTVMESLMTEVVVMVEHL